MEEWMWALLLKPLAVFLFFIVLVAPIEWIAAKLLPNGKIKKILFKKIN